MARRPRNDFSVCAATALAMWLPGCRDRTNAIAGDPDAAAIASFEASTFALDAAALDAGEPASPPTVFDAGPLKAPVNVSDAKKWLRAHGATGSLEKFANVWRCVELVVGTAREDALMCDEAEDVSKNAMDRIVTHRIVRVVRAGKLAKVLDAQVMLDALDKEAPEQPALLDVSLRVAPDGMSAVLDDHGAGTDCKMAASNGARVMKENPGADGASVRAWCLFDRDLENRLCNLRGGYAWRGDHFERDPAAR